MQRSTMLDAQEKAPTRVGSGEDADIKAWEQIEAGRFMPRRIRGSYRGGKLG
jgi:hypothetical protein